MTGAVRGRDGRLGVIEGDGRVPGDGGVTLLDAPALAALTHEHEDFPPRSEGPGLEAVQFFVPSGGSSGTLVFRGTSSLNQYKTG